MSNCSRCGALLPPNASVCEYCGTPIEARAKAADDSAGRFAPGSRPPFKMTSVIMMMVLSLITLYIYPAVWYLTRRDGLRRLAPAAATKTDAVVFAYVGCLVALFASAWLEQPAGDPDAGTLSSMLLLVFIGISIYASFHIRNLLQRYAAQVNPQGAMFVAYSSMMTLIFGICYLQGSINKMIRAQMLEWKV